MALPEPAKLPAQELAFPKLLLGSGLAKICSVQQWEAFIILNDNSDAGVTAIIGRSSIDNNVFAHFQYLPWVGAYFIVNYLVPIEPDCQDCGEE